MRWTEETLVERRVGYWGPAMARCQAIACWHGESIEGKRREPAPPGLEIGDPRENVQELFLSADVHPPLTLTPLLAVREDMVDLVRSLGIVVQPFDRVRWFRVPLDPEEIQYGKVKWPPVNKSWIGRHPEVKQGSRPMYYLGIPPDLPIEPGSRRHRFQYLNSAHEPTEWQFDPEFLARTPVSSKPGEIVVTSRAPQPFLDMVNDEEHFKVLPFIP
jgi:hypothetical protein